MGATSSVLGMEKRIRSGRGTDPLGVSSFSAEQINNQKKPMSDLECPYCHAEQEVCHDDGQGYAEDEAHEMECSECGKNFIFRTVISIDHFPAKADCLNGSPHDLNEWSRLWRDHGGGKELQIRRCSVCGFAERRVVKTKTD